MLEALGSTPVGPLFYVDDGIVPCPSSGHAAAVVEVGARRFASRVKASFNLGPNKTAVLPVLGAQPCGYRCPEVYTLLGVSVDSGLTFAPRLSDVLRMGKSVFLEVFHLAETVGFSVPIQAEQVRSRVEPVILYAAEVLIIAPGAERALNALQEMWARTILGAARGRLRGILVVAQCGWPLRLGSRMLEIAITAVARLQTLPVGHPAPVLIHLLASLPAQSWYHTVRNIMLGTVIGSVIPELEQSTVATPGCISRAQADRDFRRDLIRRYKLVVVRPALVAYDAAAFQLAASKDLPALGHSLVQLFPGPAALPANIVLDDGVAIPSRWFRLWACARLSGLWPLYLYGVDDSPLMLDYCPLCGCPGASIAHPLVHCEGTLGLIH